MEDPDQEEMILHSGKLKNLDQDMLPRYSQK